jgi:VWFA-related protein
MFWRVLLLSSSPILLTLLPGYPGCPLLASAQSQMPTFKSETTLQSIAVQVTDKQGNYVHGLSASEFTLLEDSRPQKIAFFAAEREPISLAVLLDVGRAMDFGGRMNRAAALLSSLIRRSHPEDEFFFMPFTDEIGPFHQITDKQPLSGLPLSGIGHRGSALYDALAVALCNMKRAKNIRQALVVITDGMDLDSRLKLDQVIRLVGSSSPQVFMVGLFDKPAYNIFSLGQEKVALTGLRKVDNPLLAFRRFAKESGAEAFFPASEEDLDKALKRISAIVAAEYTLAYYPSNTDKTRKIEVKLSRDGLKVLTRRTVRSQNAQDSVKFADECCKISPREYPHPWESRVSGDPSDPAGMLYHETFSDPNGGWPDSHDPNADAHYIPGGYRVSRAVRLRYSAFSAVDGEAANAGDCVIAAYGPWWTNFRATAKVEAKPDPWWRQRREASTAAGQREPWWNSTREPDAPDDTVSGVGLVFNLTETGYYALILTPDPNESGTDATLVKGKWDGTRSILMPSTRVSHTPFEQQAVHFLSVESIRGHVTLIVDKNVIAKIDDSTLTYGLVGFGVFGGGQLTVRDLVVQALH